MRIERLAAITDIHGNLPALDAVLADIAASGIETVVNLGDILSGPLWPAETAERLMPMGLPTVRGNHERYLLMARPGSPARDAPPVGDGDRFAHDALDDAQRAWVAALPATAWLGDDILLVHGTPTTDVRYLCEDVAAGTVRPATPATVAERLAGADRADGRRASLVLCGHSHQPRMVQLPEGGPCVVNPGSVGLQSFQDDAIAPHVVETMAPHARYAVLRRGRHGWSVEHRAVPYDWRFAEARAALAGARAWLPGLRLGVAPPLGVDA